MIKILIRGGRSKGYPDWVSQQYGPEPSGKRGYRRQTGREKSIDCPLMENRRCREPGGKGVWLFLVIYSIYGVLQAPLLHERFAKMARFPASIALQWQTQEGLFHQKVVRGSLTEEWL